MVKRVEGVRTLYRCASAGGLDSVGRKSNMRAVKDDVGNTAIVTDDEEEYLLNTQRCARCQHSFQCDGDFRFYCHWREDCYCIGDWADCSGYQPKGE